MDNQHQQLIGGLLCKIVPLISVNEGNTVRVLGIEGGRKLQSRLAAMGLAPGVELNVIRNNPLIIALNGSRLVLGRGMACKISVYYSSPSEDSIKNKEKEERKG